MAVKEKISDRLLNEGDNLIILFGTETGTVKNEEVTVGRGFFFKVLTWSRFRYEYDQLENIGPQSGKDYKYLGSDGMNSGDDILRIVDDAWWLYHFAFATDSSDLRIYRRMQGKVPVGGLEYSDADRPDPTAGDNFGYISGAEIEDYYNPPAFTEMVCWQTGGTSSPLWEFGFYNENPNKTLRGRLNLVGRQYKVVPITNPDVMKKMARGEIKRTIISVGGLRLSREETFIPNAWRGLNERKVGFTEMTEVKV